MKKRSIKAKASKREEKEDPLEERIYYYLTDHLTIFPGLAWMDYTIYHPGNGEQVAFEKYKAAFPACGKVNDQKNCVDGK